MRISIVTATLNRAEFLPEAIQSVLAQAYPDVEHIVVDGGSTDGTLEILKKYSHIRWISEADSGMYEAINKGIRMANGEVIGLLNSDDAYEPLVFSEVSHAFESDDNLAAVVGGASTFKDTLHSTRLISSMPGIEWDDENERWDRLTGKGMVTNAWFFRRSLFDAVGLFDVSYRVSADRDFLLRVGLSGLKVAKLNVQVYRYRNHASSITMNPKSSLDPERARVRIGTLKEAIHIAEKFLRADRIPARLRPFLRRWHSQRAYALALTALFQRDWRTSFNAIFLGLKFDPFWGFTFVSLGFKRLFQFTSREG